MDAIIMRQESKVSISHRRNNDPQTNKCRPWLLILLQVE